MERNEYLELVKILRINAGAYDLIYHPMIYDFVNQQPSVMTETLFTYNDYKVTFSVEKTTEEDLILTFVLSKDDNELVKTVAYNTLADIQEDPEDSYIAVNDPYFRFIAEIAMKYIPTLTLFLKGRDIWSVLLAGQKKAADKLTQWFLKEARRQHNAFTQKRFADLDNTEPKTYTVSLGKGVKIEVEVDMSDWDAWNAEGLVGLTYWLLVDDQDLSSGECNSVIFFPPDEAFDLSYESDQAYLDMIGSIDAKHFASISE